jgi:hypothetical protein
MFGSNIPQNKKIFLRKKAQTNICIAKELADIYGGGKADYLKRLNHRLRIKIADHYRNYFSDYEKAA